MPKIKFTLDKELLVRINRVKEKEKIKDWSKVALLLVRLGLDTYNNKNFEQFSFTLYDVNKRVKEMSDFQIKLIGRVEKVLKTIENR
ncbi:MAG: hypothetical protein MJ208_00745 [Bacilli bacterium]|nr:hypothetical protein [Bacilli bacterium]